MHGCNASLLEIIREIRLFDGDDILQNAHGGVVGLQPLDALEVGRPLVAVEHGRQRLNVAADGFAARAAALWPPPVLHDKINTFIFSLPRASECVPVDNRSGNQQASDQNRPLLHRETSSRCKTQIRHNAPPRMAFDLK